MEKEDYCTLEQVKLLKEKGYPWGLDGRYCIDLSGWFKTPIDIVTLLERGHSFDFINGHYFPCPTLYEVQKWLRKYKGIHIDVFMEANREDGIKGYDFMMNKIVDDALDEIDYNEYDEDGNFVVYSSPEEALSTAINKSLKLI